MSDMTAVAIHQPGGPEMLQVERRPVPQPQPGQVLIRVAAFGLNRSEMFTRLGHSPSVSFPRILGIEAVGTVEQAPGGEFRRGETVATAMGGMGREFDGGYAEYTCVPAAQVQALRSSLAWEVLGALPEMLQTAWGSLFTALRLAAGDRLLIRGGTTAVGLAAAAIAKRHGAFVAATTRSPQRESLLRQGGADQVFVDDGAIAGQVQAAFPGGVECVLELVGATTLLDSLGCAKPLGVVCMSGIVGNQWSLDHFSPSEAIPKAVRLTSYGGGAEDFMATPLQQLADDVASGALRVPVGPVFPLEQIVEAHCCMDANRAGGKIVMLTDWGRSGGSTA